MSAPDLVVAALEVALNRYLRLEPAALEECARLQGRSLQLEFTDLGWSFLVEPHRGGVRVATQVEHPPDVRVQGSTAALFGAGLKTAQGDGGLPRALRIEGDTELLTQFNRLLASVGFDLEEWLAKVLDDGAAHRLAQGLRGALGWARAAADTLLLDTSEYLREETRELARREDVEDWSAAVERLRDDAERFEARLARLEKRVAGASA